MGPKSIFKSNYQYRPLTIQPTNVAQKPQQKQGGFKFEPSSLISDVGGTGGAIGGAALGASIGSVVPVVGTAIGGILGAGIGGFLGGSAGSAVEQQVRDDKVDWGKVGREGLVEGILSAGPIKGFKAVGQVGKNVAKQGIKEIGQEVVEGGVKTALTRESRNLLGDAWGIRSGAKVFGDRVTPQKASNLQRFVIDEFKLPKTANAGRVFEEATNYTKNIGNTINQAITTAKPFDTTDDVVKNLQGKFSKSISTDYKNSEVAQRILSSVKGAKTPQQLWEVRKTIDDELISFSRNPNGAIPGAEKFAREARNEINNKLAQAIPGYKDLNKAYSNAKIVSELSGAATATPKGISAPGFVGRVGGRPVQATRSAIGQTLDAGANLGGRALAQPTTRGLVGRGVLASGINQSMNSQPQEPTLESSIMQAQAGDTGYNQTPYLENGISGPLDQTTKQPIQDPYPRENLMADIQRDPENAQNYIEYYQMLQEVYNPEVEQPKALTEGQQMRTDLINALGNVEGIIGQGSINYGPVMSRVEGLKSIFNAADEETLSFKNAIGQVRGAIAKARAGASMTPGELKLLDTYTPKDTDSEQVVLSKLQQLRNLYGYEQPAGGATLEDTIMQYQQGGY